MKVLRMLSWAVLCLSLGVYLQWIGARLNRVAITVNNEQMPVWTFDRSLAEGVAADPGHKPIDGKTQFTLLTDIFPTPTYSNADGFNFSSAMSLGDILYLGGIVLAALAVIWLGALPLVLVWYGIRRMLPRWSPYLRFRIQRSVP